jgi:outer membrane immunogenic protein
MKRLMLSGVALLLTVGSTLAADLAVKAPPPPPPPLWTGPFVGAAIGVGFGHLNNEDSGKNLICGGVNCSSSSSQQNLFSPTTSSDNGASFAGGGQLGYNYQFNPSFVVGGVADITVWDRSADTKYTTPPISICSPPFPLCGSTETRTFSDSIRSNWLATFRLRGGPTFDKLWIYGTGGLALADLRSSSSSVTTWNLPPQQIAASGSGSTSGAAFGYAVGAGGEYKITPNWSIFAEYLYYAVSRSYTVTVVPNTGLTGVPPSGAVSYDVKAKIDGSLVKVGLNYTFQSQ